MKKRIKMDSAILSLVIIMAGFLFLFEKFYPSRREIDNILDFFGFMILFKGILFRMAARGHKKKYSQASSQLVTTGIYAMTRNPMYLGTFLISAACNLMIWPWWCVFLYAGLFYLRFDREIAQEEKVLKEKFGLGYEEYCKKTPRIFPSVRKAFEVKLRDVFNLKEAFSTEERNLLFVAPAIIIILETFQELMVFGSTDLRVTTNIFGWAAVIFVIIFAIFYQKR